MAEKDRQDEFVLIKIDYLKRWVPSRGLTKYNSQ